MYHKFQTKIMDIHLKKIEQNFTIVLPSKIIDNNLLKCYSSIRKFYKNIKIVFLVDQKNKDLKKKDSFLDIIVTNKISISKKRNIGANLSKTKYLTFIDSDAWPTEKWLDYVYYTFKKLKMLL
jgi:glycosyltransferase involved in cell wall biosynthesis